MPNDQRINVAKDRRSISIIIKAKKNWFNICFLPIWLTGWTIGGLATMRAVFVGPDRNPFLVLWLCFWAVGETVVILTWLWNVFGRETVSVGDGLFVHRREIFGYGLTRRYPVQEVFNLRAAGYFPESSRWGTSFFRNGEGSVAVDTKYGEIHRFGLDLEERDANEVAKELAPYLRPGAETPPPALVKPEA